MLVLISTESLTVVDWDSKLFKSKEKSSYIGPVKNKKVDDLEYVMTKLGHNVKYSEEKSSEELPPLIEAITRFINVFTMRFFQLICICLIF